MSEEKEALPYTWLAHLQTQCEKWTQARETLCKAPLNTQVLCRLSAAYEREKNYVKAFETLQFAHQLIPDDNERAAYAARLQRLSEQARDMKANVIREDPFEILPLEVVINIMQIGQGVKDDFILKSSWVNRKWRQTLTKHCPELWRTVVLSSREVKSKVAGAKVLTWHIRSQQQTNAWVLRDINVSTVKFLLPQLRNMVCNIKHLAMSVTDEAVLEKFAEKLRDHIPSLESLTLKLIVSRRRSFGSWRGKARRLFMSHERDLCFLVIKPDLRYELQSIEIHDASFARQEYPCEGFVNRSYIRSLNLDSDADIVPYRSLRRLIVRHCDFDNNYDANLFVSSGERPPALEYQCDPLHTALRGAPALEYLSVETKWDYRYAGKPAWPGLGQRITLSQLKTAILPPPCLWSIDIMAPNLTTLRFRTPEYLYAESYDQLEESRRNPLIPAIQDSPVLLETLPQLQEVELVCYIYDLKSRLEEWISLLSSVKRLTIRCFGGNPWHATKPTPDIPDQRASFNVLKMLIEHPEWCPKLEGLELVRCFAPGNELVQLVRTRKRSSSCVALKQLSVLKSLILSGKAQRVLHNEVPCFRASSTYEQQPFGYQRDNFEEIDSANAPS